MGYSQPGDEPGSPALHADFLPMEPPPFQTLIEHLNRNISKNGEDLTMTVSQLDPMDICRTFPQTKSDMYSFQVHEEHLVREIIFGAIKQVSIDMIQITVYSLITVELI